MMRSRYTDISVERTHPVPPKNFQPESDFPFLIAVGVLDCMYYAETTPFIRVLLYVFVFESLGIHY